LFSRIRAMNNRYSVLLLIGILALAAGLALPEAQARPQRALPIRLARATFDPLVERHRLPDHLTLSAYPAGGPGLFLIQFDGPIQPDWKEDLSRLDVQLYDYIPDFAFLAWMDGAAAARAAAHPHVRWVGLYQPAYRLSPQLDQVVGKQTVTLLTLPTVDEAALRSQLSALGATIHADVVNRFGGTLRLTMDATQLPALVRLPATVWVEPYVQPQLLNDVARGAGILNASAVWGDLGLFGAGQIVAVADTGLDVGVNDSTMNDDFQGRVVSLYDMDSWPFDGADDLCSGHGTHVAGSVLGNGANSGSDPAGHDYNTGYAGLAPEAQLVFQAVELALTPPDLCVLSGIPNNLNALFQQAYDDGARIHTNSWGSPVAGEYTAFSQQTDQFTWNHMDFTILFAAGNDGIDAENPHGVVDPDSLGAPATAKNAITVGASENNRPTPSPNLDSATYGTLWPDDYRFPPISNDATADAAAGMAAFSSRGPTDDGRLKPDLVAPGTWILSVFSQAGHPADGGLQYDGWGDPPSRWYKYMGGTSMATPLAAGAATLVRDYYNDVAAVPNPSAALIKATLINGAYDMTPGQYGAGAAQEVSGRPDFAQGWGRVDLAYSLLPDPPRVWWYDDHGQGLSTGENVTYSDTFTTPLSVVAGAEPLRVSLVWTDYPGMPAAGGGLVNDLDLEVIGPGGTHYYGNGSAWDRTNNVEGVDILNPAPGAYTVIVHAHNVAQGTQPYALVVSGGLAEAACTPLTGVEVAAESPIQLGESLVFSATVVPPSASQPINYTWDFGAQGSGSGLDGPTPIFTYTQAGSHTVVVTATNCGGSGMASDTLAVVVQESCQSPSGVDFGWSPQPVHVGVETTFTAAVGGGTPPLTYTWEFADGGSPLTGSSGLVTHTFGLSGTLPVTLSVTNPCGAAEPAVHPVDVLPSDEKPDRFVYLPLVLKGP
jgi:subtilisin family serine protease/PKD repeat protein